MNIYKELNIDLNERELICFVGAGGKTTTMFNLAKELKDLGKKVLISTTTAIFYPEEDQYDEIIVIDNPQNFVFRNNISSASITVIAKEENPIGKLKGIERDLISEIFTKGIFDYILVEADGSKRKPIKAPAYYEPVIPRLSTKVVGVIGLDSLYKKIDNKHVHRPEIFCNITNSNMDDIITEEIVLRLITDEKGLFKNNGIVFKKYLFLNKAENKERRKSGFIIKDMIESSNFKIEKIIITSMINKKSYHNVKVNITGIILASGFSRRMGKQKLLLEIEETPIVEKVIKSVKASQIDDVILVYRDARIKSIASEHDIKALYNKKAHRGQSEAIKLGVSNSSKDTDGYMFFVGDQPFLQALVIDKIIDTYKKENKMIVIPKYNNKKGNPVLFSSELKESLLKLDGDIGGRSIIKTIDDVDIAYVQFDDEKLGLDIDTLEEYLAIKHE